MNILKVITISLFLINCSMAKQDKPINKDANFNKKELVIYGKTKSELIYKEGKFYAIDKKASENLNSILKKYNFEVVQLKSKKNLHITEKISKNPIFILKVEGDAKSLQNQLLKLTTIIDAAYIKPQDDEPE
ncbi:hypothetical protein [Lutibacter citreus]|uniref:hypothetical protein n=1 Tax=Lutibacter citreus TaxID=2138210 RepID=UPI000DBE37D8|nr:hypothetical protein [Lutibacter citreus]